MLVKGYSIQFCGNAEARRTQAEIFLGDNLIDVWAVVYDSADGWVVDIKRTPIAEPLPPAAVFGIEEAKVRLQKFVNRCGHNPPPGLTGSELSRWLMQREPGSAAHTA